jgi:hypothetical protein
MRRPLGMLALLACLVVPATSSAAIITFTTIMSGDQENPPNASPATGEAVVIYDSEARTLRVMAEFRDLVAPTTAAHIHCCTDPPGNIGVATRVPSFLLFPIGVTFGSHDETLDLTDAATYNPAFVTNFGGGTLAGAEAALIAGLMEGRAYYNIHTSTFPGGEIRGFFAQEVPEPATLTLLVGGVLIGLAARRRRLG